MANDFGKNLRILRKLKDITQDEMARAVNTSRSCISNYESGKRQPDAETIRTIADYFDVSIDYLMGRSTVSEFLNEEDLRTLYRMNTRLKEIKSLDLSEASAGIKCMVLEFYRYLIKTDENEKNEI